MTKLAQMIADYEKAQANTNELEAQVENNPTDTALEKEWDKAYAIEYKALIDLIEAIVNLTNGQIDKKTARQMIATRLDTLKAIADLA